MTFTNSEFLTFTPYLAACETISLNAAPAAAPAVLDSKRLRGTRALMLTKLSNSARFSGDVAGFSDIGRIGTKRSKVVASF